ncbi:MAG: glycogen-binding domain-containing protein [Treponema sp.]|nr:glycogen-binding domain-containing protein [Treponema sp.]
MKTIAVVLCMLAAAMAPAADIESYEFIDRLLSLSGPGAPEVYEDAVLFTAPSSLRRVGVSFANEGFGRVHWFRQLLVPQDPLDAPVPPGKKRPDPYKDSGILFFVYQLPGDIDALEYRLVIDGLWTTDPSNPLTRRDSRSGVTYSSLPLPDIKRDPSPLTGKPGGLNFTFRGPPGETVTVAGNFNGWDPFMYELTENPAGVYSLALSLPPGTYQYVFFHRGERRLDPYNFSRVYTREGKPVSQIIIE